VVRVIRRDGRKWCLLNWWWQRLWSSPARHNESLKLELSGASSRPSPIGEGKEAKHRVSYGDIVFKKIFGVYSKSS
jgi:hypothetical protein